MSQQMSGSTPPSPDVTPKENYEERAGPKKRAPAVSRQGRRLPRGAPRRLPLGEPPLVVTTHAITSFTLSHPGPAGVQPRTGAGFIPSYHVAYDPKSVRRVCSEPTCRL